MVLSAGYWLFADTYRRHFPHAQATSGAIRFAHFGGYEDFELWRDVLDEFSHEHPDIVVRQEYVVGFAGAYNIKLRQQILSHTLPDVALIQLAPFHELADHFADLSELLPVGRHSGSALAGSLDEQAMAAFQHDGKQKGLPISGGSLLIFANTECFERAARFHHEPIPLPADDWTTEDFHRLAKQLTCDFDGDGRLDQFGFWLPRWVYYLPFFWSFGADIADESGTMWRLTGNEAEKAVSFYRRLAVDQRVCPRDEEVPQLFQDVGFLTGKVALCVNGPWFMPFLSHTKLADSYVVLPVPQGPAGRTTRVTWDGVVMSPGLSPQRREKAIRLIRFLLSQSVQERIARAGRALPARLESQAAFSLDGSDDRRERFIDALLYSRLGPMFSDFPTVDRAINRRLEQLTRPGRSFDASAWLAELAQDSAIQSAFSTTSLP